MYLNRFSTRFALAVLIAVLVLFGHERHHLEALQIVAGIALLGWAVAEIGYAFRRRHVAKAARSR